MCTHIFVHKPYASCKYTYNIFLSIDIHWEFPKSASHLGTPTVNIGWCNITHNQKSPRISKVTHIYSRTYFSLQDPTFRSLAVFGHFSGTSSGACTEVETLQVVART